MTIDIDADEVQRRYDDGWSLRELAAAHGVAVGTITRRLSGRRSPGRRPRADIDTAEIVRLHDVEGISLRDIATDYGVAPSTITRRYAAATS